jgi:hypothetical protein
MVLGPAITTLPTRSYQSVWTTVSTARAAEAAEMAALAERAQALAGAEFFSELWRKHNLQVSL